MTCEAKRVWLAAVSYWIVAATLCVLFYPVTIPDAMTRYAPMADHFARGEWSLAFHPRFGVLFQVLSGVIVMCTGCGGDVAVQIVSIGFLSLSAVPLWFIVRQLFDSRTAWWAVALTLVSDDFSRYAFDGLRDTGKCLGLALVGLGVVKKNPAWFALGLFVLTTLFSYCFAISAVLLFGWCVYWVFVWMRRGLPKSPALIFALPISGWTAGAASVFCLTHAFTGHWLPSPHYIKVLGAWL